MQICSSGDAVVVPSVSVETESVIIRSRAVAVCSNCWGIYLEFIFPFERRRRPRVSLFFRAFSRNPHTYDTILWFNSVSACAISIFNQLRKIATDGDQFSPHGIHIDCCQKRIKSSITLQWCIDMDIVHTCTFQSNFIERVFYFSSWRMHVWRFVRGAYYMTRPLHIAVLGYLHNRESDRWAPLRQNGPRRIKTDAG